MKVGGCGIQCSSQPRPHETVSQKQEKNIKRIFYRQREYWILIYKLVNTFQISVKMLFGKRKHVWSKLMGQSWRAPHSIPGSKMAARFRKVTFYFKMSPILHLILSSSMGYLIREKSSVLIHIYPSLCLSQPPTVMSLVYPISEADRLPFGKEHLPHLTVSCYSSPQHHTTGLSTVTLILRI